MSTLAQELLTAFDALSPAEKREVADEIVRRAFPTEDISEEALRELAAELFQGYDAEEAARAPTYAWRSLGR